MGVEGFAAVLKSINFLKDVILYVKHLKFMVLAYSGGVSKFFAVRGDEGFLCAFRDTEVFSLHPDTKSLTPSPQVINDHSLTRSNM